MCFGQYYSLNIRYLYWCKISRTELFKFRNLCGIHTDQTLMTSWRWHSSLQPWLSLRFTKPTSSNTQELQPNRELWFVPCTKACPVQSSTVQPKAKLTGVFQLNSISPLASVATAWAVATQKAKFHIERENPLISWPLLSYEWTRKWKWEQRGRHGVSESRPTDSF